MGNRVDQKKCCPGVVDHAAKAARLSHLAKAMGWREALNEAYPEILAYLDRKPVFTEVLPLDNADVLEIGPGFGQFTSAIAVRAKSVRALEVDESQAAFITERMKQDGIDNVEVKVGGATCLLPYPDETVDVVVLNLVFEWCATRLSTDHASGQQTMLNEIWRVLRPGGRVYIATKNRFAIRYLLGRPDEHYSGMRFGSAAPKWFSDQRYGGRPPGRLYSWVGLKRLLERSGYRVERGWWAIPDVRQCEQLVPIEDIRKVRSKVPQGPSRGEQLLMSLLPSGMVKHFAPGINFLAVKLGR